VIVAVLAAVAIGGKYWLSSRGAENRTTELSVPVSVTIASQRDMPVYLSGLGTIQALNTVPVHSQVDGKLIEIAFIEGLPPFWLSFVTNYLKRPINDK
jgi:multidrug efflux system membrane fusion protein